MIASTGQDEVGSVLQKAGVTSGIDMALHLVARLHSVERAREVRRYIQYDPEGNFHLEEGTLSLWIQPRGWTGTDDGWTSF